MVVHDGNCNRSVGIFEKMSRKMAHPTALATMKIYNAFL